MSLENKDTIQEKMKKYNVLYKKLAETGSMITKELNASLSENAHCFEEFVNYTIELKAQLEPFVKKYEETRQQLEKFNNIKKEFNEIAQRAILLEKQVSGLYMPDVGSLKGNLDTILSYLEKVQESKQKAEDYLLSAEGGVANIASYFSTLQSELESKLSLISKLSNFNLSKANIELVSNKLNSLPNPKIDNILPNNVLTEAALVSYIKNARKQHTQIRWLYREFGNDEKKINDILMNSKDKINFDKLSNIYYIGGKSDPNVNAENNLGSQESNVQNAIPPTKNEVLSFFINELVVEGRPGLSHKTLKLAYNHKGLDTVLDELKGQNMILGSNGSLKLSEEIFSQEKKKIESEINAHLKINKNVLIKYIISKDGSISTQELLKTLCENKRDRVLLKYELRTLKENNELIGEKSMVILPNKSNTQSAPAENIAAAEPIIIKNNNIKEESIVNDNLETDKK